MGVKGRSNSLDLSKSEVGEIDTRAPFSSVKAAVSLFGEVASSGDRSSGRKGKEYSPTKAYSLSRNSTHEQKTLAAESQLHLAQKELDRLKEQIKTSETTHFQSLAELEKAKKTVSDLTSALTAINESKQQALKEVEASNSEINQNKKFELEQSREHYTSAMLELDDVKQELRRLQKEFEASTEAKNLAFDQESKAKQQSEANALKAEQISKEIAAIQESIAHVKLATDHVHHEESMIRPEKDSTRDSYSRALEETETKLSDLKNELNPELQKELESKLVETDTEIDEIRKKLDDAHAYGVESLDAVTAELDSAKEVLHKLEHEESEIRTLVESLKVELETITKQHDDLKHKDDETETLVSNLHVELQKRKSELEEAVGKELKAGSESDGMTMEIRQLKSGSETALKEAETMRKEAEEMREEAESIRAALTETEKKLEMALKEADAAKATEAEAVTEIKKRSSEADAARSSTLGEVEISREEYESMNRKEEESEKLTEMKVSAAAAGVEAVKAREEEVARRVEATKREIEETELARMEAMRKVEMAEAAKKAVEGELTKWRERELKKGGELERSEGGKRLAKKSSLLPNLSGIFHRHKKGDTSNV